MTEQATTEMFWGFLFLGYGFPAIICYAFTIITFVQMERRVEEPRLAISPGLLVFVAGLGVFPFINHVLALVVLFNWRARYKRYELSTKRPR